LIRFITPCVSAAIPQVGVIGDFVFNTRAKTSQPGDRAFCRGNFTRLFRFAETALEQFKRNCYGAIVDGGLNRVDVMCMQDGSFVVNEFESLEAFCPARAKDMAKAEHLLRMYWFEKLKSLLV
jgi:hypothetical protein